MEDSASTYTPSAADTAAAQAFSSGFTLVILLATAVMVAALWRLFTKAGKPGWAAIVPIYNSIVLLEIVGRPIWWIVLFFIPFVNFIVSIIISLDLAKAYGKGPGFAIVGLLLFPFIGYPMLAFGSSTYTGPVAGQAFVAPPAAPVTPTAPPAPPAAPTPPQV
ncbi:MAG TPA: DUF5684 domain-containing protein [Candidatus Dormibacteraeota bacterium]|nr:DUF5684 domain-containing protein [Candidatus Dormibacteraeota bacterium]